MWAHSLSWMWFLYTIVTTFDSIRTLSGSQSQEPDHFRVNSWTTTNVVWPQSPDQTGDGASSLTLQCTTRVSAAASSGSESLTSSILSISSSFSPSRVSADSPSSATWPSPERPSTSSRWTLTPFFPYLTILFCSLDFDLMPLELSDILCVIVKKDQVLIANDIFENVLILIILVLLTQWPEDNKWR